MPIALRRQFQLRRAVIPKLLAHEKLCARRGALGDEAGHQHGNQQAAADSDQTEHLSTGNSGMHAHTCTGQEAVSGSVDRAAQRRHAIERGGPWAHSCNRGQRCHEYDEGSTRLISPHFAVPISGWTRARIGPGGRQRRRRWPFHRRKPVLAVRQGGSMPCNGFTAPIRHGGRPDPPLRNSHASNPATTSWRELSYCMTTSYRVYYLLTTY